MSKCRWNPGTAGCNNNFHIIYRAMFTGELAESRQTEVVIRDIDERAMELLIDFAYTSQVRTVTVSRRPQ